MTASAVEEELSLDDLLAAIAAEPADEWFLVWMPPVMHRSWHKRLFGGGSWALLTVEQYHAGRSPADGWTMDGGPDISVMWLAVWAETLLRFPVELLPHTANLCLPQRPHDTFRVPVYLVRRNS